MKIAVWGGLLVGSTLGGLVPELWGESAFSGTAVLLSVIGGLLGIWGGYKLGRIL
ncbi:MAG: hypothetical protein R3286_07520 [Gammaproteobacteria bacterium]|nr:hypothetical protein [Gammaproteobacteria bacterium]